MHDQRTIPIRLTALALGVVLALTATIGAVHSDDDDAKDPALLAAGLKATFIYKFVNFPKNRLVAWPDEAFEDEQSPVRVGVIGDIDGDPFDPLLDVILGRKKVASRSIEIDRIGAYPPADDTAALASVRRRMRRCHALFIINGEMGRLGDIRAALGDKPVLTISDAEGFARRGGVIQFVIVGGTIRFEVNRWAAEQAGLRIRASLARIAEKLHEKGPPEDTE